MAGTTIGRQKTKETMIKKLGSEEAYKEYMRSISARGGKTPPTKPRGFAAMSKGKLQEIARKGGRNSHPSKDEDYEDT